MSDVYIFWDNSNIFIPTKYVANRREGLYAERDVRVHFDNLFTLARAGRNVNKGVCVGSVPPELDSVWKRLRSSGVTVELYERGGGSGKEQGVDQCLQVHMLRALADIHPPLTAVLLTGDGAGYEDGAGF
ncbi:MAG TPA: NYN domain-containing protein, partial [Pyrinomonadaceae bacterium]|nr:NYN domain-containing protein [Pyrinomonadaceae bacterium]